MNFLLCKCFSLLLSHGAAGTCSLTLLKIKTEGISIYTENLTAKLQNSIQILAYCGIAKSVFEQPGPGAPTVRLGYIYILWLVWGAVLDKWLPFPKRAPRAKASKRGLGLCYTRKCFGFCLLSVPFPGSLNYSGLGICRENSQLRQKG